MKTQCTTKKINFQPLNAREVVGEFNGSRVTSDAGGILLREVESEHGIIERLAYCFKDYRNQKKIEHPLLNLLEQRIFGIALGYEDLIDHDALRHDPMLALLCNKADPLGNDRLLSRDRGKAIAGKSTLNRLENALEGDLSEERYKKITYDNEAIERLLLDTFIEGFRKPPKKIILDIDATDDTIHGGQEGRFFHGYYQNYCYLPLYIFSGKKLLYARLKTADKDPGNDALDDVKKVIGYLRKQWPHTKIILRGDGGFCREPLLSYCEGEKNVFYIIGLAKNDRLKREIEEEMKCAKEEYGRTGKPARRFKEFRYKTQVSWSTERRVIGKAEYLEKGENPRFVVTSIPIEVCDARTVYEDVYCARGDMENRIKEQQLYLFADRTSCETIRQNQLRLFFSSFAYVMINLIRELLLEKTVCSSFQCHTIREKLFKIGALIQVSARRVHISFSEGYPYKEMFLSILNRLQL